MSGFRGTRFASGNLNTTTIQLPNRRHLLLQMRFQLLGGLIFAILLPALIRMSVDPRVIWSSNMQATIFAAFVAHTTGYMLYKRIGNFPGVAAAGYIFPTFALTYGLVFVTIFFFRFDYSRFQARLPTRLLVPAIVSPNAMPAQSATQSNPSRSRPMSCAP